MIRNGLIKIGPHRKDYSLLHTLGALAPDPKGLPSDFSIYDGRDIPDQNELDERFDPPVRPLPEACTAEAQTFSAGLADKQTYLPDDFYFATPPGTDGEGRDLRVALQTAIDYGFRARGSSIETNRRLAYFNCYGKGPVDDYDAVKIALWISQSEKRAVSVGSWWYWGYPTSSILGTPSFDMSRATLHNWIVTGWVTLNGVEYLECIPWVGMKYGDGGRFYMRREVFNACMAQPWTGAFTMTKVPTSAPVPIGWQAVIDHLVYYIRSLFNI